MSQVIKSKALRRNSARLTRAATHFEDDAEQALKEIVAAQAKFADDVATARKPNAKSSIKSDCD